MGSFFDNIQFSLAPKKKKPQSPQPAAISTPDKQQPDNVKRTPDIPPTPSTTPMSTVERKQTHTRTVRISRVKQPTQQPQSTLTPKQDQRPNTPESHDQPSPPATARALEVTRVQPNVVKISRTKRIVRRQKRVIRTSG